jgi:prepilin-type N-terminal cleavage/methylation domain-containing protein
LLFNLLRGNGRGKTFNRRALSLIELLTTIVIMGVLTTAAIPLGEVVFIRDKELELKDTLIVTRGAIDKFYASVGRYPYTFNELRWVEGQKLVDTKDREDYWRVGMPFLRKSPPINPFASSNQAWIVILTNSQYGLESMPLEEFLTTREIDLVNPDNLQRKEIYDIQYPPQGHKAFKYQITIYTSLEGHAYSSW